MCDYSLHHVASRPAKVSDKLVTTKLTKSSARGFAAVDPTSEQHLMPGRYDRRGITGENSAGLRARGRDERKRDK